MIGLWEALIIVVVLVLLFGGRKLPALGHAVGRMLRNYRQAAASRDEIEVSARPRPDALPDSRRRSP